MRTTSEMIRRAGHGMVSILTIKLPISLSDHRR
jgi:hypothetical protein